MVDRDSFLQNLGHEIRRRREVLGLSQEAFAILVGLHRTYVGALECGERNVTIGSLLPIASGLNLTIAELMAKAEGKRG